MQSLPFYGSWCPKRVCIACRYPGQASGMSWWILRTPWTLDLSRCWPACGWKGWELWPPGSLLGKFGAQHISFFTLLDEFIKVLSFQVGFFQLCRQLVIYFSSFAREMLDVIKHSNYSYTQLQESWVIPLKWNTWSHTPSDTNGLFLFEVTATWSCFWLSYTAIPRSHISI